MGYTFDKQINSVKDLITSVRENIAFAGSIAPGLMKMGYAGDSGKWIGEGIGNYNTEPRVADLAVEPMQCIL